MTEPSTRHVFIAGASGLIGRYVVNEFVDGGWHVIALVHRRESPELAALAASGAVSIVRGDLGDTGGLGRALGEVLQRRGATLEAIVNCAGRASDVGWASSFRQANLTAVECLVHLTREHDCGVFVHTSTTDVYGLRDFSGEDEDELPCCERAWSGYPRSKIAAEALIREQLPTDRYVLLRPAAVWGVGDATLTPRIVSFLRWSPWIVHFGKWRGRNRWPLAHVRNVAAAAYLAATLPQARGLAINVLDDERTTVDEFYRLLAAVYVSGKRLRSVALPMWAGRLFALPVTMLSNLLDCRQPVLDPSLYALATVSSDLDFSNGRLRELMSAGGRRLFTRDAGMQELRGSYPA